MRQTHRPPPAPRLSKEFIKRCALVTFLGLAVAGVIVTYHIERSPSSAQPRPVRLPLFVRGYIAAAVGGGGETSAAARRPAHDVFLPGIKVFLRDAGSNTDGPPATTDLSGRFTLRPPGPGRYRVCWSATGFDDGCSKDIYSVGNAPVHTSTIRIPPDRSDRTTVVHGTVKMKDGSRPRRLEPLVGVNAFARVELLGERGNVLHEAYVNNFGEYLLPRVPVKRAIAIRVRAEGGVKEQRLLPQANLAGAPFHPINLVIGNTPPRVDPLIPADGSGRRVRVVAPGGRLELRANASDPDGDTPTFRWLVAPGSGSLSAADRREVSWKLPAAPGRYSVEVLVSDGKGGHTKETLSVRADNRGVAFSGKVDGTDAPALAGARVEVNGQVTGTAPDGTFSLFVRDARRFVLNIRKPGYALVSRIYDDSVTGGRWTMTRATVTTLDPRRPMTATDRRDRRNCPGPSAAALDWRRFPQLALPVWQDGKGNVITPREKLNVPLPAAYRQGRDEQTCGPGASVEIPADALRDSRGQRATGDVEVAVSTVDLLSPEQMPGDYTVRLPSGSTRVMQSYGAATVEVTSGGRAFNLRPGTTATVRIPVDRSQLATGAPPPPTIPILFYNERDGVWVEEGKATLQGNVYVARVKHFSAINTDLIKTDQSCVEINSPTLPASYKLEWTVPQPGGAAPATRTDMIDNSAPSVHVIYNLPSNTNIVLVPIRLDNNLPIGTFVVNTGGPQNPTNPNRPAQTADGYPACSTSVTLTEQVVPDVPISGEFLHGLYSFAATNLTELAVTDPTLAAEFQQATLAYYTQIDPRGKRTTLAGFQSTNGFPTGEVVAKFANSGDLGFGRDMHCTKKANADIGGDDVACYVTNYGDITTPDADDAAAAVAGVAPVATVAMEFSQVESPPGNPDEFDDNERVVKFYVYNADGTQLLTAANLDGLGARPIPQLCMVCHNGEYPAGAVPSGTPTFNDRADVKMGSKFLPFDLHFYTFTGAPFDKASQQDEFKALNEQFVELVSSPGSISSSPAIVDITDRMYSGGPLQDESFVVGGWNANPLERGMYRDVVARACRTCHIANVIPSLVFEQTSTFNPLLGATEIRVCDDYVMPHAKATNQIFWLSTSPHMPAQLQAYGDSVAATLPGTGWTGQRCGEFTPGGATPASPYDPIQAIWDDRCTVCHSGGSPPGNLNLAGGVSYGNIFNVNSSQVPGMKRVAPNSTANSYLFHKIQGTQGSVGGFGGQMPADGPPFLSAAETTTIQNWINAGAPGP